MEKGEEQDEEKFQFDFCAGKLEDLSLRFAYQSLLHFLIE
jgi:hypothetical protein